MSKLNEAIIKIRCDLQKTNMKKSGKNKFAGFTYYELSDILPTLNKLMLDNGVNDLVSITSTSATLTLIKGEESQIYEIPFFKFDTPLSKAGKESMQPIQYLGALNTYYKRYLYLNAFGITDGEIIDAMDNSDIPARYATKDQVESIVSSLKLLGKTHTKTLNTYKVTKFEDMLERDAKKLITMLNGALDKKMEDVPTVNINKV